MKNQAHFNIPFFALGFRPFFTFAALSALALLAMWRTIYHGAFPLEHYYPPVYWHAHEMLLGYSAAVIAGFLLTAVKNWTGEETISGDALAALCLLWLYGRITPYYSGLLPDYLLAAVDLAFLPVLAGLLYIPIMQAKQYKNLLFIGLLLFMAIGNFLVHGEMLGFTGHTAWSGLHLVFSVIIVMILTIAGRVFPFFTDRGIPGTISLRSPLLDALSIASAVLVFVLLTSGNDGLVLALAALSAAIINLLRVMNWYVQRVWYVPLLWILYTGYGWIILGFILTALSAFQWVSPSLSLHAFAIGGIGVLTLGMMARVALGHTGRALKVSACIAGSFVLINIAVVFRVLMPMFAPGWYTMAIYISTALWLAAFALFSFVYAPILALPRVDGKPG